MSAPDLKARPIWQTVVALFHAAGAAVFMAAGVSGVGLQVPPVGVAMMGAVWTFPAFASAALAWQHWRLLAALRDLAKARRP